MARRTGHGPDGTPPQGHDFADLVRQALHAAANQVKPRADGLDRIRARIRSGPAYAGGRPPGAAVRWRP